MLINLVARAYQTNLPNLPDNLTININRGNVHNKNLCQPGVSLSG